MTTNGCQDVLERETRAPGLDDETLRFLVEEGAPRPIASLARLADDGADARTHGQGAFGYELGDDPVGSIRVDLERLTQRTYGGKRITRAELTGHDGPPDRVHHLLVHRQAGAK